VVRREEKFVKGGKAIHQSEIALCQSMAVLEIH
jgi:hypothetical protein